MTRTELDAEIAVRAGCVALRRARKTKTLVGIYISVEAGIDTDCKWATVCEDHGAMVCHSTRALANASLSYPDEWCDDCREKSGTLDVGPLSNTEGR